ncbi:MAG: CoA transferase [Wenzhouxiangella sp.]|nr:CoA transferase [Wenzhouxiangella sp.]
MIGALSGCRVLELSRILAGPWAGQLLADFGAEVIKIERPGSGDDTRRWGPPFLAKSDSDHPGESAYFLSTNRNKQSVAIDFSRPGGQELVAALADHSDVLIENFKVGTLARHGLDYASLSQRNPALVYCSITGFGQTGPYARHAGYDAAVQAMGGLMSLTGLPDEQSGGGPQKVGVAVADLMTGMYAANAIQAALIHRQQSGRGQHIDLALFDTQVAWLANQASNYLVSGEVPSRQGTAHPNIVPYQAFATADGYLMLAVGNDPQFARFARLAGHEAWASDIRFAENRARVTHRETLVPMISDVIARRSTQEWLAELRAAGVPAAPINDLAQVFADPQVKARGMVQHLPHPQNPELPTVANPVRFSATPVTYRCAPPLLGADTAEVLERVLGLGPEQTKGLAKDGVIGVSYCLRR